MRFLALIVATFPLTASPVLAEPASEPPLVVTGQQVSFGLSSANGLRASTTDFPNGATRADDFSLGDPEGSGFTSASPRTVAPRVVQRVADQRVKRPFRMPWMGGVYQ